MMRRRPCLTMLRGLCGTGAVLLCLGISGCGGDSSPTATPTPTPAPTPPPPTVVLQENIALDVGFFFGWFFDISSTGTIDATVNYTFDDSMVAVWVATGECGPDAFFADQCDYVATSFDGPKPRRVSATSQPAGAYSLIIANFGPQAESFALQVVFTAQAGAASRTGGSDLSSRDARRWTAPTRRF